MKLKISFFTVAFLLVGLMVWGVAPNYTSAQELDQDQDLQTEEENGDNTAIEDLLAQIAELQAIINQLTVQVEEQEEIIADQEETIMELERTLALGSTGEDVEELQRELAKDPEIYPEGLVTGFFGPLTEAALSRWQARNLGPEHAVGVVGPITRDTFNERRKAALRVTATHLMDSDTSSDVSEDSGVTPSTDTLSPVSSVTPGSGQEKVTICHVPPGNPLNARTISIGGPAVSAHLAQASYLGECEGDNGDSGEEVENDVDIEDESDDLESEDDSENTDNQE